MTALSTAPPVVGHHRFLSQPNPFGVCARCRRRASAVHNATACGGGCSAGGALVPCGHTASVVSVCPTYNRLDGCRCAGVLGRVDHPTVAELAARRGRR